MDLKKLEDLAIRVRAAQQELDRARQKRFEANAASQKAFEDEEEAREKLWKLTAELTRCAAGTIEE